MDINIKTQNIMPPLSYKIHHINVSQKYPELSVGLFKFIIFGLENPVILAASADTFMLSHAIIKSNFSNILFPLQVKKPNLPRFIRI